MKKSIAETAKQLGCSTQVVSNWVKRGKVEFVEEYGRKLILWNEETNKPKMINKSHGK
jgi:predicted site-specific integrase-resolvase